MIYLDTKKNDFSLAAVYTDGFSAMSNGRIPDAFVHFGVRREHWRISFDSDWHNGPIYTINVGPIAFGLCYV
jgi:hypothetical protein